MEDHHSTQPSLRPQSPPPRTSTTSPLRLPALHHYHNAPEVAPAHGLEHDDTIWPSSDKCTVTDRRPLELAGEYRYDTIPKPPTIIFGMKLRTFIIVAILFACVLVGAAVGGAVGGKNMQGGNTADQLGTGDYRTSIPTSASKTTGSSSSATSATATPTYTPLSDCPASNGTSYTSTYTTDGSSSPLRFTKYCDTASPLSDTGLSVRNITEAFVYTMDDCIEMCASYNYHTGNSTCTVAVYNVNASRPADCWIGMVDLAAIDTLGTLDGVAVALLDS